MSAALAEPTNCLHGQNHISVFSLLGHYRNLMLPALAGSTYSLHGLIWHIAFMGICHMMSWDTSQHIRLSELRYFSIHNAQRAELFSNSSSQDTDIMILWKLKQLNSHDRWSSRHRRQLWDIWWYEMNTDAVIFWQNQTKQWFGNTDVAMIHRQAEINGDLKYETMPWYSGKPK